MSKPKNIKKVNIPMTTESVQTPARSPITIDKLANAELIFETNFG